MRRRTWSANDLAVEAGNVESSAILAGGEGTEIPTSDIRLKEHIEPIGRTRHDLPLYKFHYKGGSQAYAGVMAQDVLEVMPEAVSVGPDGFYRVNYRMLGITMQRLGEEPADMTGGGEGVDLSDIRVKDGIERIGTVTVTRKGE
jgi:hypothetical protein